MYFVIGLKLRRKPQSLMWFLNRHVCCSGWQRLRLTTPSQNWTHWVKTATRTPHLSCSCYVTTWHYGLQICRERVRYTEPPPHTPRPTPFIILIWGIVFKLNCICLSLQSFFAGLHADTLTRSLISSYLPKSFLHWIHNAPSYCEQSDWCSVLLLIDRQHRKSKPCIRLMTVALSSYFMAWYGSSK